MPAVPYPASLWRRLAAAVYDLFLLVALLFAATGIILPFYAGDAVPSGTWWFRLYILLVPLVFLGWFWTHGGQTLGMRAWRLQLRDAASGELIGWRQVPLRYICAAASWVSVVGMLFCLFDRQKRSVHDLICATEIVVLPRVRKG
ncbi:MAG: hypothetical protein CMN28_03365 [Salinisphaeraceae bacterium]|nr:hypothetical protein [Salinisphaeraceae bacterium]